MKPILFIVLDGWGISHEKNGNAIVLAKTPSMDYLKEKFPNTEILAAGEAVGLPKGQMGNSEVGHLNIGAGQEVYQEFMKINKAIEIGEFFNKKELISAMESAKKTNLHLIGLVSDGGVHSHENHLYNLLKLAGEHQVNSVFIHAFLDGRDTHPESGIDFIKKLIGKLKNYKFMKISTIMGRYYAMDRDKRWERTEKALNAMILGKGKESDDPVKAIEESYKEGVTDEFVKPIVIVDKGKPVSKITDGDTVICFNFRPDRVRQITQMLNDKLNIHYVCMTQYHDDFKFPVVFPPERPSEVLGKVFERNKIKNLRIAETEKYAHVTYFFNGGDEKALDYETRVLISSPKVPTYDLKPEMSAYEITEKLISEMNSKKYNVIICNFANPDMVGHTGNLTATVSAIEAVDRCLEKIFKVILELDWTMIITSDHGNAETMVDEGEIPHTAHTANPVPFIIVDEKFKGKLKKQGALKDIATTILGIMNLSAPKIMTGNDLRI